MDPARKRTIRLVVALSCALLLAGALVYTQLLRRQRGARAEPARHRRGRRRSTSSPARSSMAPTATAARSTLMTFAAVALVLVVVMTRTTK